MIHIKEIEPYNKFWGNCITNMFLSILLEIDPSYEDLIYQNAYEYSYISKGLFHIDYTQAYYDYFKDDLFVFKAYNFPDRKAFLSDFKNILINNCYVALNVDLFYWNREGAYYNKVHRSHYSFIIGFDEEQEVFFALEDDVNLSYKVRKIPVNSVLEAFLSEHKDGREDYRIITFKYNRLKPYTFDISQVKSNAKMIIKNLEEFIGNQNLFDMEILADISNVHFYSNEFSKISYRLHGNALLFEVMKNKKMLNEVLFDQLTAQTNEICNKWKLVSNIFRKYCVNNRVSEIHNAEERITDLFKKEKEMWLAFIE